MKILKWVWRAVWTLLAFVFGFLLLISLACLGENEIISTIGDAFKLSTIKKGIGWK